MLRLRLGTLSRVFREQVAHDTGLCVGCRRLQGTGNTQRWASSAKPKDDRGILELIEVLEMRHRQLQAGEGCPTASSVNYWTERLHYERLLINRKKRNVHNLHNNKPLERTELCQSQMDIKEKKQTNKNPPSKSAKSKIKTMKVTNREELIPDMNLTVGERKYLEMDTDEKNFGDLQKNMHSYLEACIFLGDLEKAKQFLFHHLKKPTAKSQLNVALINLVLKAYAKQASLEEIDELYIGMKKAGLKPNLESYAAALEALGCTEKSTKEVNKESIESCLSQMEMDGMSIDQLFQELSHQDDERQVLLKVIRHVKPDYKPPPKVEINVDTPLVMDFYKKQPPPSYPKMDFTVSELQKRFEEQLSMEICDTVTIESVEARKPVTEDMIKARTLLAGLRADWEKALLHAFIDSKSKMKKQHFKYFSLYPYLCLMDDEQYVQIMLETFSKIPPTGESFCFISQQIGLKIYNRFFIRQKLKSDYIDRTRSLYSEYCTLLSKEGEVSGLLPREFWEKMSYESFGGLCVSNNHSPWTRTLMVKLGTHFIELMVQTMKLNNNLLNPQSKPKLIPVLYHMYSFRSVQQIGLIKPHPIYGQILSDAEETSVIFDVSQLPMLCPPLPWISPQFGPYMLCHAQLMRSVEGVSQHQLLLEKCPRSQLFPVLDALNQLGGCAWRINQPILDIIVSIFNDKGNEKLDIPPPMSEAPVVSVLPLEILSSSEKQSQQKELTKCKKKVAEMFSLRISSLYRLSIANHFRDKIFWFPHNLDFRGRTYPCPPYFNHLGGDVTRALLLFAEGHPLGPHGLDWLKIHLVNLTGLKKKCSLKQRKEFADEIMEDILDSADYPMTGKKWWMTTDEPWQALACCMEIANVIRSLDPEKYVSHFPVHQDGSCNGLQHYAALGRDEIGAKSVNLMPCSTPQDVYSEVAQQVEEFRKRDAKNGIQIAKALEGRIGRKVVKQTVMTLVYGVTKFGGRLQIEKRLSELDSFPKEDVWNASHYLVNHVFATLKEMFTGTREIQNWLTENARMISKSGSTVEWVTPLGLPVIQPYRRIKSVQLSANLQQVTIKDRSSVNKKPDTMKQKNAFPPNFIHSLDSTHMMLTALHCHAHGLTFVSVHDCFWTHADKVDIMNKICREQFVALHSQPILQDLSQNLIKKYCTGPQEMFPEIQVMKDQFSALPETGTFDLENVKDSKFFFS